ncbi:MAG: methyltransferase domain-containing protein [Xenococcaceae cyanobacterium MO_207.B15]|nr:methyltransferase domain-containing protein [Xenococcaceae cyanobacterium MO_207.B15]
MTEFDNYKQQVTSFFDNRTQYDNDFTYNRALKLLECVPLSPGEKILDVATGTAIIALAASKIVGDTGKVIGIDISPGMLAQARAKIAEAKINNIQLIESDIDNIDFPENSFETIFCSSSIPWFKNITAVFDAWYRWLNPGGKIAFSCYSQESFLTPLIVRLCREVCDTILPDWNSITGTAEKCCNLLEQAGFKNIKITTEQIGHYLTVDTAKQTWQGDRIWINPQGNPLTKLSTQQLQTLKTAYDLEIEKLATHQGVWQDITIFFVVAHK